MSPPTSSAATVRNTLRQTVRAPRESDGVGSALRQIFSSGPVAAGDFTALISRLDKIN